MSEGHFRADSVIIDPFVEKLALIPAASAAQGKRGTQ
jgi:hypothetical protein